MTLREANDILQNPNDHWSHEIFNAKKYLTASIQYLVNAADHRFMDEAQIAINYVDERIAATRPDVEVMEMICGNCNHYDPVGYCLCDCSSIRFPSPLEDATDFPCFDSYKNRKVTFDGNN